eukprot:2752444-Rhodomonas_salina.1
MVSGSGSVCIHVACCQCVSESVSLTVRSDTRDRQPSLATTGAELRHDTRSRNRPAFLAIHVRSF